jgi:hypothetical protein
VAAAACVSAQNASVAPAADAGEGLGHGGDADGSVDARADVNHLGDDAGAGCVTCTDGAPAAGLHIDPTSTVALAADSARAFYNVPCNGGDYSHLFLTVLLGKHADLASGLDYRLDFGFAFPDIGSPYDLQGTNGLYQVELDVDGGRRMVVVSQFVEHPLVVGQPAPATDAIDHVRVTFASFPASDEKLQSVDVAFTFSIVYGDGKVLRGSVDVPLERQLPFECLPVPKR